MGMQVTTTIDHELCIGCGRCIKVCPQDTISLIEGKAVVTGRMSLNCGHCQAICPTGAARVGALDPETHSFKTFTMTPGFVPFGGGATPELVSLMASRRSTRNYMDTPVPMDVLHDLVKVGCLAPSGTNCQLWKFGIIPDREGMLKIARLTMDFFSRTNRLAANPLVRLFVPQLREYHRLYAQAVEESIQEFKAGGRESLFHGAPAAITISSKPGASCPAEDALLASQNILLAAHSMGYGTCLIGMLVEAVRHDRAIRDALRVLPGERLHSVIVVGVPNEDWKRPCGRMKPEIFNV
ncbi:MAG TPA: nitroreductase family protein [Myxococcota bacterium]|nr:nitroreductase family protein [Myxococcota bacterium]